MPGVPLRNTSNLLQQNESLTKILAGLIGKFGGWPFDLAVISENVTEGIVTVSLQDDKTIAGVVETINKEGAERLQQALEAYVALGARELAATRIAREEIKAPTAFGGDPSYHEIARASLELQQTKLEIGEKILQRIRFTKNANQLQFLVVVKDGIGEIATSYAAVLRASMKFVEKLPRARGRIVLEFSSGADLLKANVL